MAHAPAGTLGACFYANVCTITGPATAVAGPMSRGCSIHASPRLFDSPAPHDCEDADRRRMAAYVGSSFIGGLPAPKVPAHIDRGTQGERLNSYGSIACPNDVQDNRPEMF
jgi:hypothetical protein